MKISKPKSKKADKTFFNVISYNVFVVIHTRIVFTATCFPNAFVTLKPVARGGVEVVGQPPPPQR